MDNNDAVSRQQDQREVDTDSRCNNQIETRQRWAYMCNGWDRRWRQWMIVRQRQARAAKMTAGIEHTSNGQWQTVGW
jgi:hypothetical protein